MQVPISSIRFIRWSGLLISYSSILLVFLSSIPFVANIFWLQQFSLFLICSFVSVIFIDIFIIDILGDPSYQICKTFLQAIISILIVLIIIMMLTDQNALILYISIYLSYGIGLLLFLDSKYQYKDWTINPTIRWFVFSWWWILAFFLSICYASFILSLWNINDVNCTRLQWYVDTTIQFIINPFHGPWDSVAQKNTTLSERFHFSVEDVMHRIPGNFSQMKKNYIDEILMDRKVATLNACELLFSQISTKIDQHHQTIQVSLLFLLLFLLWPFIVFFLWIETILAYILIWILVKLWFYSCMYKEKIVTTWQ